MTENTYTAPSREDLKGLIARGAAEDLEPGDRLWKEVRYDQGKIDSTFESYEMRNDVALDEFAGEPVSEIPEDAQKALSTAISYASTYLDKGDELPVDRDAASDEFNEMIEISASMDGMAPAAAGYLDADEHEELFGDNSLEV